MPCENGRYNVINGKNTNQPTFQAGLGEGVGLESLHISIEKINVRLSHIQLSTYMYTFGISKSKFA